MSAARWRTPEPACRRGVHPLMANLDQTMTSSAAPLTDAERRQRAIRRVAAIKGFYVHFAVFVIVMAGLLLVDALSSPGWWVQWVLLGWGIGVAAHAAAVWGHGSNLVADWEERKIKQLMDER
jgi:hypothetical protein